MIAPSVLEHREANSSVGDALTYDSFFMTAPILVFDSGVGGLSVLSHLRARLPQRTFIYVCDNAALPYGTKPMSWLQSRIVAVCRAAVRKTEACALVVACNTASTVALAELRSALDVPVIGTVPAIKPAAEQTRSGVIGVLATTATVQGDYLKRLMARFSPQCDVVRVAADALVEQAERKLRGEALDEQVLEATLAPLWTTDARLDTVVLGCTHFPLLRHECDQTARLHGQTGLLWLDSGAAIARRTACVVGDQPSITDAVLAPPAAYSLATAPDAPGLARALSGMGVPPARALLVARAARA